MSKTEAYWVVESDDETIKEELPKLKQRANRSDTVNAIRWDDSIVGMTLENEDSKTSTLIRTKVVIGQHSKPGDESSIIVKFPNPEDGVEVYHFKTEGDYIKELDKKKVNSVSEATAIAEKEFNITFP